MGKNEPPMSKKRLRERIERLEDKVISQREIIGRYKGQLSGRLPLEQRFIDERAAIEAEKLRAAAPPIRFEVGKPIPMGYSNTDGVATSQVGPGTYYSVHTAQPMTMTISANPFQETHYRPIYANKRPRIPVRVIIATEILRFSRWLASLALKGGAMYVQPYENDDTARASSE